jgi:hypothetical protein
MIENAVYVDSKVAIFYYQPIPKYVKVGTKEYVFDCQHGISLVFVTEEEVQPMLDAIGGCCGGKRKIMYLASPVQYSHWLDGKGGRK